MRLFRNRTLPFAGTLLLGMAACSSPNDPTAPASAPNPTVTLCTGHAHFSGQINSFDVSTVYAFWIEPPDSAWAVLEASEYLNSDSSNGTPALRDTVTDILSLLRSGHDWNLTTDSKRVSLGDTTSIGGPAAVHVTSDSVVISWFVPEGGTIYYLKKVN